MKKSFLLAVFLNFVCGVVFICQSSATDNPSAAAAKVVNADAAIKKAQAIAGSSDKVKYLVAQANEFMKTKQYQDVVNATQYVLSKVDPNSADAKRLLAKAKDELAKVTKEKINQTVADPAKSIGDIKNAFGGFGKK